MGWVEAPAQAKYGGSQVQRASSSTGSQTLTTLTASVAAYVIQAADLSLILGFVRSEPGSAVALSYRRHIRTVSWLPEANRVTALLRAHGSVIEVRLPPATRPIVICFAILQLTDRECVLPSGRRVPGSKRSFPACHGKFSELTSSQLLNCKSTVLSLSHFLCVPDELSMMT